MKTKKIVFVALSAILIAGFSAPSAQALTTAELQQLIIDLQAQIAQLQAQLQTQQGTVKAWCYTFNTNLRIGDSGNEVDALETALNKEGGLYRNAAATSNFDEELASAVVGFQEKYRDDILIPNGLKNGTGYVGPATRKKLNSLYGCSKQPTTLLLTVTSPNGDQWAKGSVQTIKWNTNDTRDDIIIYLTPVGSNNATAITWGTKNTGSYGWYVNTYGTEIGPYQIKVCTSSGVGAPTHYTCGQSSTFYITDPTTSAAPSITVLSPNGGEKWQIGQTYTVAWKSSGVDKVAISLDDYRAGPSDVLRIENISASLGSYSLTIPNNNKWITSGSAYQISVIAPKEGVSDASDSYFSIVAAATTTPPVVFCDKYGDVNEDGTVDMTDSLFIAQYINGSKTFTAEQKLRADVNQDGSITAADSTQIAEYRVGTRTTFTACSKTPACGSYGDVNGNGYVNQRDALLIAEYRVGTAVLTDAQKTKADVDGNGSVTMTDSLKISQYVQGILTAFPVCILGSVETGLNNVASLIESLRKVLGR